MLISKQYIKTETTASLNTDLSGKRRAHEHLNRSTYGIAHALMLRKEHSKDAHNCVGSAGSPSLLPLGKMRLPMPAVRNAVDKSPSCTDVPAAVPSFPSSRTVFSTRLALPGSSRFGITLSGLEGPCANNFDCRCWSSINLVDGSHSLCSGTPSAPGKSPWASRSEPQKEGRRTGAGVTGREGRSNSVGKSVSLRLGLRCSHPEPERLGERMGSLVLVSEVLGVELLRTWTLARRFCGRQDM